MDLPAVYYLITDTNLPGVVLHQVTYTRCYHQVLFFDEIYLMDLPVLYYLIIDKNLPGVVLHQVNYIRCNNHQVFF